MPHSRVQTVVKLPAGIYNITVGKAVWKSVGVKDNEKTMVESGELVVEHAPINGLAVIDPETEVMQGQVSAVKQAVTLI